MFYSDTLGSVSRRNRFKEYLSFCNRYFPKKGVVIHGPILPSIGEKEIPMTKVTRGIRYANFVTSVIWITTNCFDI